MEDDIGALLARSRNGDADAWAALTARYTNLLWSIARGMRMSEPDAADAVQTTWLRLVERLDTIREPERLGSWLATILRRECIDMLRRSGRLKTTGPDDWEDIGAVTDPLDDTVLRDERDAALWRAFGRLRPPCRRLLRALMADPPPSYTDVAAALDVPIGSIGPTRQRCLKCLRGLLDAGLFDDRGASTDLRKG
ncbi:RNA polymerase sigma factor [Catenuloplanes sp. NPDC051500]|uniref:RNA polymerase sigma factor n=1 Tax=Catenuloplanes sp. NPDC051500 TaxID=3363959 RepID=UPI00379134B2